MIHSSTRTAQHTHLPARLLTLFAALFAAVFTAGCGATPESADATSEAEEVEASQAALAADCGNFRPVTTLLQPEFTSSIPQAMGRLKITARNLGGSTCSRAGTIEVRRNGKLINTERLPARDYPSGFTTTNRGLDRVYSLPVDVKVCFGASSTCLSKTINPPIGE